MIGSLKGKIKLKTDKFLILETNGVGYKIYASPETLIEAGKEKEEVSLWTHTHVREDTLELYGFSDRKELEFFEMLINIPGIGPRSALGILGIAGPETLQKAISSGDTAYLTKVSGIGRKTAEKIVLELKEKMGASTEDESLKGEMDALEALKSLGYSQKEAREALKKVSSELTMNAKIKEALKVLGTNTYSK